MKWIFYLKILLID